MSNFKDEQVRVAPECLFCEDDWNTMVSVSVYEDRDRIEVDLELDFGGDVYGHHVLVATVPEALSLLRLLTRAIDRIEHSDMPYGVPVDDR